MKQTLVHVLYAIPLILYTLSVAFLINQPIELINPFEYYNEMEMPTLSLYIMMIIFVSFSMFGFIIAYRFSILSKLNNKSMLLFILFSLLFALFITRMSVLLGLAVMLPIIKFLSRKQISSRQYLLLSGSIYAGFLLIFIIPLMILFKDYEAFLNVNQFQQFIEIYNKHQLFDFIRLNITLFISHLLHYILVIFIGMMPGLLMGMYHRNKREASINIIIHALIFLISGTAIKLLIFKFSYSFLQFSLTILGSSLQGIGLMLLIILCVRYIERQYKAEEMTMHALLYISTICIIELIIYSLFTGIYKLPYPAPSIVNLLQYSVIVALIIAILFVVLSKWSDQHYKNNHR